MLALQVQDSETCKPIPHAVVEIWHCDACGLYSGVPPPPGGGGTSPTGRRRPAPVHVGNEKTLSTQLMFDEALNARVPA